MLNHPVEREIAAELWLVEPFWIGSEGAELDAEKFVLVDGSDKQDEWREILTALLQCHLLLQFLRFLWQ